MLIFSSSFLNIIFLTVYNKGSRGKVGCEGIKNKI